MEQRVSSIFKKDAFFAFMTILIFGYRLVSSSAKISKSLVLLANMPRASEGLAETFML